MKMPHNIDKNMRKGLSQLESDGGDINERVDQLSRLIDMKSLPQKKQKTRKNLVLLALLCAAIIAATIFYFAQGQNSVLPESQVLYAQYFEAAPPLFDDSTRGESTDEANEMLAGGNEAYKQKDYKLALEYWNKYAEEQENDELNTFRGIAALYEGDSRASQYLSSVKGSDYRAMADWYLALFYLRNEKIDLAKNLLTTLASNAEGYKSNASKSLLYELEK